MIRLTKPEVYSEQGESTCLFWQRLFDQQNIHRPDRCVVLILLVINLFSSVMSLSKVCNSNLCDWAAVLSSWCFHFDVTDLAICPKIDLDYSADSPSTADGIVVIHDYDVIDFYVSPFCMPRLPGY